MIHEQIARSLTELVFPSTPPTPDQLPIMHNPTSDTALAFTVSKDRYHVSICCFRSMNCIIYNGQTSQATITYASCRLIRAAASLLSLYL